MVPFCIIFLVVASQNPRLYGVFKIWSKPNLNPPMRCENTATHESLILTVESNKSNDPDPPKPSNPHGQPYLLESYLTPEPRSHFTAASLPLPDPISPPTLSPFSDLDRPRLSHLAADAPVIPRCPCPRPRSFSPHPGHPPFLHLSYPLHPPTDRACRPTSPATDALAPCSYGVVDG